MQIENKKISQFLILSKDWVEAIKILLGRVRRAGPGYPLQSFFRASKKDFRSYPSRKTLQQLDHYLSKKSIVLKLNILKKLLKIL